MSLILKGKLNERGYCKAPLYIPHSTLNTALEVCRVKRNILSMVKSLVDCSNILKLNMSGQDPLDNVIVNYVQESLEVDCEHYQVQSRVFEMNIPRNTKEGWHRENNSLRHGYKSLLIIMVPLMANFDIQIIPMVQPFDGVFFLIRKG